MSMTHYMELLMINSPWNLLLFMAMPVVLAETIAITELVLLFSRGDHPIVRAINHVAGILAGLVFLGIAAYLIPTVVVPVTAAGEWRTWVDWLAVFTYLLAGIPMILIALLNLRIILGQAETRTRMGFHVACVASFLVLSHVAMIAGMADPAVAGWQGSAMHTMDHATMDHSQHTMTMPDTVTPMDHSGHDGHMAGMQH